MAGDVSARVRLDPDFASIAAARQFVRRTLTGAPPALASDMQLIASELITNAIEHGPDGPTTLAIGRRGPVIELTVESPRPPTPIADSSAWRMPSAHHVIGRGLGIVRRVADSVEVTRTDTTVAITATRHC